MFMEREHDENAPQDLKTVADSLGFKIVSWEDGQGGLSGHSVSHVGSQDEIRAFLTGWSMSRDNFEAARNRPDSKIYGTLFALYGEVPPGHSATITSRPFIPFRPMRFAVPDEIARDFVIEDMRIGNMSMFPQAQSVSATMFATRIDRQAILSLVVQGGDSARIEIEKMAVAEFGRETKFPTCQVAQDLVIIVRNLNASPRMFQGYYLGNSMRY